MVVASTASPFKFAKDVYDSIWEKEDITNLQALDLLAQKSGASIPMPLSNLESKKVNFNSSVSPSHMYDEILKFLQK